MAFSAAGTRPMTLTGHCTSRSAAIVASTAAPPDMSRFIDSMPSGGLMSRPPVSKVMPLPTSTTVGVDLSAPTRRVVEADQPGRRRGGRADGEHAAEAFLGEPLLVPDRDLEAGRGGELLGLLGQPGGRLEVGRHRGEHPRAPAGAAGSEGTRQLVVRDLVGRATQDDAGDRSLLGPGRAPVEAERPQHRADDEGAEGLVGRDGRDRGGHAGAVLGRPRQGRRRRAGSRSPTAPPPRRA